MFLLKFPFRSRRNLNSSKTSSLHLNTQTKYWTFSGGGSEILLQRLSESSNEKKLFEPIPSFRAYLFINNIIVLNKKGQGRIGTPPIQ